MADAGESGEARRQLVPAGHCRISVRHVGTVVQSNEPTRVGRARFAVTSALNQSCTDLPDGTPTDARLSGFPVAPEIAGWRLTQPSRQTAHRHSPVWAAPVVRCLSR